jgi:hypothetical protein
MASSAVEWSSRASPENARCGVDTKVAHVAHGDHVLKVQQVCSRREDLDGGRVLGQPVRVRQPLAVHAKQHTRVPNEPDLLLEVEVFEENIVHLRMATSGTHLLRRRSLPPSAAPNLGMEGGPTVARDQPHQLLSGRGPWHLGRAPARHRGAAQRREERLPGPVNVDFEGCGPLACTRDHC